MAHNLMATENLMNDVQPFIPQLEVNTSQFLKQARPEQEQVVLTNKVNTQIGVPDKTPTPTPTITGNSAVTTPPSQSVRNAMVNSENPKESLNIIRGLLVGPVERLNEARLDEILTILEEIDESHDKKVKSLSKQLAALSTKIEHEIEKPIVDMDNRLDTLSRKMDTSFSTFQTEMDNKVSQLSDATDGKFVAISTEIDEKISRLSMRVHSNLNSTISELGRAFIEVGKNSAETESTSGLI